MISSIKSCGWPKYPKSASVGQSSSTMVSCWEHLSMVSVQGLICLKMHHLNFNFISAETRVESKGKVLYNILIFFPSSATEAVSTRPLVFCQDLFISLRLMPPAFAGLEIASSMARSTTKSNSNSSNNQQQQ